MADPTRRPFAMVGDGAFQMTGTELATMGDQRLRPIVLLLNNGSYGMLEAVDAPRSYFGRRAWDYLGLARALGFTAERVHRRYHPRAEEVRSRDRSGGRADG